MDISTTEHQLLKAINTNDLQTLKFLLTKDDIQKDLGKNEWTCYSPPQYNQMGHYGYHQAKWNWPQYSNDSGAPLHYSASTGKNDMVKLLVEAGMDVDSYAVNESPKYRFTALHCAVLRNYPDTVKVLLELGADEMMLGTHGSHTIGTALDWAMNQGHVRCVNILRKHTRTATGSATRALETQLRSEMDALKKESLTKVEELEAKIREMTARDDEKERKRKGDVLYVNNDIKAKTEIEAKEAYFHIKEAMLMAMEAKLEDEKVKLRALSTEITAMKSAAAFKE